MPWVIGIDEAGYGPNLGPLVQAAARARLPAFDLAGWESLNHKVRRAHERKDHRILIDDSKKVYRGGAGLGDFALALPDWGMLESFLPNYGVLDSYRDYRSEGWTDIESIDCTPRDCPLRPLHLFPAAVNVVTARRLNVIIAESGSKAPALLRGYVALVRSILFKNWKPDEPVVIIADKHGGRHYYAGLLQDTFPDGWIVADCETPEESRYRVMNLPFECTAIFRPKADAGSVSVALASMMAKYVREVSMQQFNAFWAKHVPGLKPTAGYPGDAKRFYSSIEPAMMRLGIAKDAVWRNR